MKVCASAPGKVILLGEHFVVYGTNAILCAIQKRASVSVESHKDGVCVSSIYGTDVFSSSDDPKSASPHHRPILQIANEAHRTVSVSIESDIPPGVGLGSSSAYCVAAAGAILNQNDSGIIDVALRAERSVFASASGADTAVCHRGGIIEFTGKGHESFDGRTDIVLAVASTGRKHSTVKAVDAVRRNKEQNPEHFESVREQVVGLIGDARAALHSGDLVSLGVHMSENHKCLRDIGVSDAAVDKIVAAAAKTSYGAKLTGAGVGGCVIALVDDSNSAQTLDAMRSAGGDVFEVRVDSEGLRVSQDCAS